MKIKRILVDISKKHTWIRKVLRKGKFLKERMYYLMQSGCPVDENMVLFEAFMGRKYADSPRAIYEFMVNSDQYAGLKFVWFFKEPEKYKWLEDSENTLVCKYKSHEYYKYYAKAKYWVTNSRISDAILKKQKQIYIQCWHGTPLKRLGYDIEVKGGNAMNSVSDIRYKYKVDSRKYTYMLSPSAFCTDKFASAFNLKAVNRENIIIEEGYPRNDFLKTYTRKDAERIKQRLGIDSKKKIILYAPTWRDNQHQSGLGYTYKNEVDFDFLRRELGEDYIILFRAHYFVANKFDFDRYKGFVYDVSGEDEINDLYVVSDLLITDYSSVFFDYAILKRPIIFYMYDLEFYQDEIRGFYLDLNELPGKIVREERELVEEIKSCEHWQPDEKYKTFNETYNYLDDGNASRRVVEKLITL